MHLKQSVDKKIKSFLKQTNKAPKPQQQVYSSSEIVEPDHWGQDIKLIF